MNVIVVGIVEAQVVMTMGIVGLQDAHPIEGLVIILPGILLPMVEDQGGIGPGHLISPERKYVHGQVA